MDDPPDILGAGADNLAGAVLLDGMADPADRPAEREHRQRGAGGQTENARERGESEVDGWPLADQCGGRPGDVEGHSQPGRSHEMPAQQLHQFRGTRIAGAIQRMSEAIDRLASTEALPERDADV